MTSSSSRPRALRVLPMTIGVLALVLSVKTVGLVRLALGTEARAATEAPAPAPPTASATRPSATPPSSIPAVAAAPSSSGPSLAPLPAAPPASDISDSERALLLDLRNRREALDARARRQDAREAVIDAAERRLSARVEELQALQTRLEQLEALRTRHEEANWQGLVKLYEQMKPRDAAVIFNDLDMQVLLPVVDRMKEMKAAPVLAAMQPDKARLLTAALARLRLTETTPAAAAAPPADAAARP